MGQELGYINAPGGVSTAFSPPSPHDQLADYRAPSYWRNAAVTRYTGWHGISQLDIGAATASMQIDQTPVYEPTTIK